MITNQSLPSWFFKWVIWQDLYYYSNSVSHAEASVISFHCDPRELQGTLMLKGGSHKFGFTTLISIIL